MVEPSLNSTIAVPSSIFSSPLSRRVFFAGMAAVSGSVLCSSLSNAPASAQDDNKGSAGDFQNGAMEIGRGMADMTGEPWGAGMNGYAV